MNNKETHQDETQLTKQSKHKKAVIKKSEDQKSNILYSHISTDAQYIHHLKQGWTKDDSKVSKD